MTVTPLFKELPTAVSLDGLRIEPSEDVSKVTFHLQLQDETGQKYQMCFHAKAMGKLAGLMKNPIFDSLADWAESHT